MCIPAWGFNFYHIKDAAICLIIQFEKILPWLHKTKVCVCVCVFSCLKLARAVLRYCGVTQAAIVVRAGLGRGPRDDPMIAPAAQLG